MIGKNEVGLLLKRLNSDDEHPDGISPAVAEVEWVMNRARKHANATVNRAELRSAVALWYPFVYNRRRVEDLPSSSQASTGRRRRAVAGMLGVHKHHVSTLMHKKFPRKADPENPARDYLYKLSEKDLGDLMSELVSTFIKREVVGKELIDYLASTADLQGAENFEPDDIKNALAMWLCTRDVQPIIDTAMIAYDESLTGPEQRRQVHDVLTELNDGIPVTWVETDWILESSDIDGNGTISRDEMKASVGWWFLHVARRQVKARKRWGVLMPWLCSASVCLVCAYLVAATSVRFTEEKTKVWLENTILAVLVKQLLIDPLKVLFCGSWLEPIAALFSLDLGLAEFDLSEAVGEVFEDMAEDGLDEAGTMMAVQSLTSNRDWEQDVEKTTEEIRKDTHTNVFLGGSRSAARMRKISQKNQVQSHALQAATEATRDSHRQLKRMQSQRAEMNAIYAEKIAQKRLDKGLNRGSFAARAEVDMIAVSQFMAAEQKTHQSEKMQVKDEIVALKREEEAMLHALKLQGLLDRAKAEGVDTEKLTQIQASGDAVILQIGAVVDATLAHAENDMHMDIPELKSELETLRIAKPETVENGGSISRREANDLRMLKGKLRRAEKKLDRVRGNLDEMQHESGNEKDLLKKATRERQ